MANEKGLIIPLRKDKELLTEILTSKKNAGANHFDIWWLGQSGFLIQWNERCLLLDPYLSDSLTKKYANTAKPHVRISERVIDPDLLTLIDVVTSSHNHTDHLDGETLIPVFKNNPDVSFVIPEANRGFVTERVHCALNFPIGLNDKEKIETKGFTFFGMPAAHNIIERNERGQCKFMSYVIRFGKWNIYHSGDTLWFDGMTELIKPFNIDVAFLPINGNDPSRGVAGNMNAKEAAEFGKTIGAKLVIPHHYDLFEFNTVDPLQFSSAATAIHQPHQVLQLGERVTI